MSQVQRQTNLFVSEDWKSVYDAFRFVNFTSYDFNSIRESMVEYIRLQYPEEFNDWIASSEFVALIDLLAYLGQSLAFRIDLNVRENFLDTAERRESVLKLARMLSYDVKRNRPAFGLVKIVSLRTDEPILDSNGNNLSGISVDWNDLTNPDWLEQFILILNSAFNDNSKFGFPIKKGFINSIRTELYEFDNVLGQSITYPFDISIAGTTMPCEIINPDFNDLGAITEAFVDPFSTLRLIYRNDNAGNSSANSGFFLPFKQGRLSFSDFQLIEPIENRVIDIDVEGINETDVWFQEIDENGQVISRWEKVPTVAESSNIIYNSLSKGTRNIYSVISRENDKISLRFADGRFGNIPQGFYRVWYRTSNGLNYTINPSDIQNRTITIPYFNSIGQQYNLSLTFSLQASVNNSTPSETNDQIKNRAPKLYYTQDRMINGEDYNVFPLVKSGKAEKVKAVNRTYSGHSRFINVNDPTGTIQNTNVFAEDGLLYKEYALKSYEISHGANLSYREIIDNNIIPELVSVELNNFVRDSGKRVTNFDPSSTSKVVWRTSTHLSGGSTGFFEQNGSPISVGFGQNDPYIYINIGSLINMVDINDVNSDGIWVKIEDIIDDGSGNNLDGTGKILINERIDDGLWAIKQVMPAFSNNFSEVELNQISDQFENNNTFGIGYDYANKSWYIIESQNIAPSDSKYDLINAGNTSGSNIDASWLIRIEYLVNSWKIYVRNLTYVFESDLDVRFFYSRDFRTTSIVNGKAAQDSINILRTNSKPNSSEKLNSDLLMALYSSYVYVDGYVEPRRVKVTLFDTDLDGTPDDPLIFEKVVGDGDFIFWEKYRSNDGYEYFRPFNNILEIRTTPPSSSDPQLKIDGDIVFVHDPADKTIGNFYQYDSNLDIWVDVSDNFRFNPYGRNGIYFQWRHYADRNDRIDPAITNIIDIYVLTTSYRNDFENWLKSGGSINDKPEPETSDQLRLTFGELENYKAISDQIIWRPAKFKVLFGNQAEPELQATFKVVKIAGLSVSDNEIKSRILKLVDEYFSVDNWDFGDTFYFTELAAYIHSRMSNILSSVVLVPVNENSAFGDLFQVRSESDEIFISSLGVNDIQIVDNLTDNTLRLNR